MDIQGLFSVVLKLSLLGSVMAGVIVLMKKGFHNKMSAHWHYYIWLLLIARLIIPYSFETSLFMPEIDPDLSTSNLVGFEESLISSQTSTNEVKENNSANEEVSPVKSSNEEKIVSISPSIQVLPMIWIAGATITLLIMLIVNFHFQWRISKMRKCDDRELLTLLEECKEKLKNKSKVKIIYDESTGTPSVVGLFRPKILLNKNMFNRLSNNEKKYVLLHELTHIKRYDILVHWLIIFIQAIHWFNPVIWYSFSAMRKDCEISCDASVLSRLKRAEHLEYGSSLLTVIEQISKTTFIPRSIGISTNHSHMKLRLERITMFKKQSWKWITLSSTLAVGVTLSGFTTFTNAAANNLIDTYEDLNIEMEIQSIAEAKYLDYYDLEFSTDNKEVTIKYYPNVTNYPFTEQDFKPFQSDVQQRVEELLKSRNYDDYEVNVLVDWVEYEEWAKKQDEAQEPQKEGENNLFSIDAQIEQEHDIEVNVYDNGNTLDLEFLRDGERIANPEEINNYHREFIDLAKEKGTIINFNETSTRPFIIYFGELGNTDNRSVIEAIDLGLKEIEELKVTSTTLVSINDPIFVNTDIDSSDPNAKEVEKKIKQLINEFLEYKPISEKISGPMDVIVQTKE
ncbi:M56 family metallopeptidase [Cytobacillus sp. IB215665]|uniref:M56 family metallopeptidase n=1 Tax=Cytobacillus sp. IB215665 TaxID=3097357 RepID=UPI002A17DC4F|nr:M56 family metallopeptidase [Cytobacillus sp. IB215665]MDX8367936.1 M56 family metallopeptidase [Cytobacillus sp. IB215665]